MMPEEDDLDLSDVPMDESENDSDFSEIIEEEAEQLLSLIFGNIDQTTKVSINDDGGPLEQQEPEEELDKEERTRLLMDHLSPDQMSRYEFLKRSSLTRGHLRKLAYSVLNQSVSPNVAIILGGVGKLFIGEIVEKAREVKLRMDKAALLIKLNEKRELLDELHKQNSLLNDEEENKDVQDKINTIKQELKKLDLRKVQMDGPLQPEHIREAWRLYQIENDSIPNSQWRHQGERDGLMFR